MSFFCPWQDARFEKCRRIGDTACLPGKPGCVLHGKVQFVRDSSGWGATGETRPSERRATSRRRGVLTEVATQDAWPATQAELLVRLQEFPSLLRGDLVTMDPGARVGRWTVGQVVHHLADVHAAGLARVRRALTELEPRVEAYDHESWARLEDAASGELLEASLAILEGTHARWCSLLRSLGADGWSRAYRQSQPRRRVTVAADLVWHVEHGERHRRALRESVRPPGSS